MSVPSASAQAAPIAGPPVDRQTYRQLATRVKLLSWASLAYMTLEGTIAILAGVSAGSVALIGFGRTSNSGVEEVASKGIYGCVTVRSCLRHPYGVLPRCQGRLKCGPSAPVEKWTTLAGCRRRCGAEARRAEAEQGRRARRLVGGQFSAGGRARSRSLRR